MKNGSKLSILYAIVLALTVLMAHYGSRAVTTLAENRALLPGPTIVIDAGHGGVDGGATSCEGFLEKQINLDISLRLRDSLNLMGYHTRMIRTTDCSVHTEGETIAQKKRSDLKHRLKLAQEAENTIFLSIHQNYYPDSRYFGPQVFYSGAKESQTLAEALQKALDPSGNRQCKQAKGVWLMERLTCPAVLIECGFLSNLQEEAKLRDPEYQKKLAAIIAATAAQSLA